jgi:uncharacterized caspase-like protein
VDEVPQPPLANRNATTNSAKRYAVVVGIDNYSGANIDSLSFCAADAEAFYDALLTYCEYDPAHVTLFSDGSHAAAKATRREDILAAIATMSSLATEEDSILFFFAGHGTRDDKDSYLLTNEFRRAVIPATSIPLNMVNEAFSQSKARLRLRFFDACHSGKMGARAVPVGPDIRRHFLIEAEGWATLSACKEDEYANEDHALKHGIFSYCLIKGLSGEAKVPDTDIITLNSLVTYTVLNTIEITKERGLQQTPVRDGNHAGDQVLATVRSIPAAQVPPELAKVQETPVEQLKPRPEKVPQFVTDIRALLQDDPTERNFVAPSQQEKLALGDKLVQIIYGWCQGQERQYHEQLEEVVTISVKRQSIRACPLNLKLAEYIENSKIKQAVDLNRVYRTETISSGSIMAVLYPQTQRILDGVSEMERHYNSAVLLTISTQVPLRPICAMVVAVIPSTFGLYLLLYSCSTRLMAGQRESWDAVTFSMRTLRTVDFSDKEGEQTLHELQDLFPQLISFFAESCTARQVYLRQVGILGQSLI